MQVLKKLCSGKTKAVTTAVAIIGINKIIFWKQFYAQIPNMQQIYFAGGESLIIEEHYEILEECIPPKICKRS